MYEDRIRRAEFSDVAAMVELSEQKQIVYERYQPTFWRKAEGSREAHLSYFETLIDQQNIIALVCEDAAESTAANGGELSGFVIATLVPAPPVYDPGGLTCLIDDFCVADEQIWETVGNALLTRVAGEARLKGAVQVVAVCGHLDEPKRQMLRGELFTIASEWYVKNIG